MPISRCRLLARASITFETFAHAATSTEDERRKDGRQPRDQSSRQGSGRRLRQDYGAHRSRSIRESLHGRSERGDDLIDGDVAPEPDDDRELARLIGSEQILFEHRSVHRHRHPEVGRRVVQPEELLVHDPDDGEDLIVEAYGAAHRARVSIEQAGPCLMTQDRNGIGARRSRVELGERAAGGDAPAQRVEVVARYERRPQRPALGLRGPVPLGDHAVEQIGPFAELLIVAPPERASAGSAAGRPRAPADLIQAVGIADRVGAEDVGIEDGEDDRHERERDGERRDRGERERAVAE